MGWTTSIEFAPSPSPPRSKSKPKLNPEPEPNPSSLSKESQEALAQFFTWTLYATVLFWIPRTISKSSPSVRDTGIFS